MSFGKLKHQVRKMGRFNGCALCVSLHLRAICSGTHTHSGPAGFLQYTLYQITSYGFFEETMVAFVEGIAQSIKR